MLSRSKYCLGNASQLALLRLADDWSEAQAVDNVGHIGHWRVDVMVFRPHLDMEAAWNPAHTRDPFRHPSI